MANCNTFYSAQFEKYPFPVSYCVNGKTIGGIDADACLAINGTFIPLHEFDVQQDGNSYILTHSQYALRFDVRMEEHAIHYTVSPAPGSSPIEFINFEKLPFLSVDGSFSYARDLFNHRQWHQLIGRGLNWHDYECGQVHGAWPEHPVVAVHACAFKDDVCCFIHTPYAVEPLTVAFYEDPRFPFRSGKMVIGLRRLYFDLKDKKFDSWTFSINFVGDLNDDGKADECDYQLALREYLPEPCPIYKNAVWYKIMNGLNGQTLTTFKQTLEIIAYISQITQGAKQIVYLTGWQATGHDSNYPSFNILNSELGTREDLLDLIEKAKTLYNCTVSVHINVDDSYTHNPGWREDLISRDIDGKPMTWEIFQQKQAYHINHTKDVRSGDIFRRLDEFLELVPITETVHLDAFRNMNYSWEEDEFIGPDKEFYCGQKEIIKYFNDRGIDVSTEGYNGMVIETSGAFTGFYHLFPTLPILYHNKIYGGGGDSSPVRMAAGIGLNRDLTYAEFSDKKLILRPVVMRSMLYRYLQNRKMLEYRDDGRSWRARVRYDDGTIAYADNSCNYLEIIDGDGTTIATESMRLIPLDGGFYVYHTEDGWVHTKLPKAFRNKPLKCKMLTPCEIWPEYQVDGDMLHVYLPSDKLMFFCIDESRL